MASVINKKAESTISAMLFPSIWIQATVPLGICFWYRSWGTGVFIFVIKICGKLLMNFIKQEAYSSFFNFTGKI